MTLRDAVLTGGPQVFGIAALNPGDLPFSLKAGSVLEIDLVQFTYAGPAAQVAVGMAWVPRDTTDFNNGLDMFVSTIFYGFSGDMLLPDTPSPAVYTAEFAVITVAPPQITVPTVGNHLTRRGQSRFVGGDVDVWNWIIDTGAIAQAGLPRNVESLANESFFLKGGSFGGIDTDAAVINIAL